MQQLIQISPKLKKIIEQGQEWRKKKIEEGWSYTCFGWLSSKEIKEAGFVFDNDLEEVWDKDLKKIVKKARGYNAIPTKVYIIEDTKFGTRGTKYRAPTAQFLQWYDKRVNKEQEYIDKVESKINEDFEVISQDNNIDNITF